MVSVNVLNLIQSNLIKDLYRAQNVRRMRISQGRSDGGLMFKYRMIY